MAIPFKTFTKLMVQRLNTSSPEIRKYLNLKPHVMVLNSDYLRELGLSPNQIQEIHQLAKNKAKRNKGEVSDVMGWNPITESLLLVGGNNLDRARGISKRINQFIGAGTVTTQSVASITPRDIKQITSKYEAKLDSFTKLIDSKARQHGLDISTSLSMAYSEKSIEGEMVIVVTPASVALSRELDKTINDVVLSEITNNTNKIKDIEDPIANTLINTFLGSPSKKSGRVSKKEKTKIKGKALKATSTRLPPIERRLNIDLFRLKNIINSLLHDEVESNMEESGAAPSKSYLRYQKGRFARSAKVESMTISREGLISSRYSYMRYPYEVFEVGHEKGSAGRSPKRLITKSIRDIITGQLGDRIKTRSTLI